MTGTPAATNAADALIEEVKSFFKRHYESLKSTADVPTKIKFLIKDGYVWMLGIAIYLLFKVYKQQRASKKLANAAHTYT
jgi:hypothetical protein